MFYRRRASPKHRYNIIEEDYGGGGHRTRLIDLKDQLLCLEVPPAPLYKGARGGAASQEEARQGGVLLPPGVGLPPFLIQLGEGEGRERGEKGKGGRRPSLLVQFVLGGEGARGLPWQPLLFSTLGP